jgi:hypothetical protein
MPQPISNSLNQLTINTLHIASIVLVSCVVFEIFLFFLDYFVNYSKLTTSGPIRRMSNIAREDGIASWFAVTQTLLAGVTCIGVAMVSKAANKSSKVILGWSLVAFFFCYMSVDDGAQIHERLGSAFKNNDSEILALFPSYPWHVFVLPVFIVFGFAMAIFLYTQLNSFSQLAAIGVGVGIMALAVGLDFIEGLDRDHPLNIYTILGRNDAWSEFTFRQFDKAGYAAARHFSKAIEETLEMMSISLFWFTFIRQIGAYSNSITLRFSNSKAN